MNFPIRKLVGAVAAGFCALAALPLGAAGPGDAEYRRRVKIVSDTPGLVAFWDFVRRENDGRFTSRTTGFDVRDYVLDAVNYVRDYWDEGRPATYADFPLLNRGPFGQAIRIRAEASRDFRPCLLVPRERFHGSRLDVKGPRRSVSMVAWVVRESGNHAVAGIWHEGTDLKDRGTVAARVERGRRQYAIFAGLAANDGASAVHVSENGAASFGDRYARNLAVTPEVIPAVPVDADGAALDGAWSAVGFVFDNGKDTVTAYLDGKATEYWIDEPQKHPFFRWPAEGWRQAHLRQLPGLQEGENPDFPADQFYRPPESRPRSRQVVATRDTERDELHTFEFTKVLVTLGKDRNGKFMRVIGRKLAALKVNPFWFPHDLYAPASPADGGPFTIGRVIHSGRSIGFTGYIGGVAVFDRPLSPGQMQRLAEIGRNSPIALPAAAGK